MMRSSLSLLNVGIVSKWIDNKGFGFIKDSNTQKDYFVHFRSLNSEKGHRGLNVGQEVQFDPDDSDTRSQAVNVCAVGGGPLPAYEAPQSQQGNNNNYNNNGGGGGRGGRGGGNFNNNNNRGGNYNNNNNNNGGGGGFNRGGRGRGGYNNNNNNNRNFNNNNNYNNNNNDGFRGNSMQGGGDF